MDEFDCIIIPLICFSFENDILIYNCALQLFLLIVFDFYHHIQIIAISIIYPFHKR